MAKTDRNSPGTDSTEERKQDELLFRYFEGDVSTEEIKRVHKLLESDKNAAEILASVVKNAIAYEDAESKEKVRNCLRLSPEEQAEKIVGYVEEDKREVVSPSPKNPVVELWARFRLPVLTFATTVLAGFIIGRPLYLAWESNSLTDKGLSYLSENHFITSREQPRPTGGLQYSEFGPARGETASSDSAAVFFRQALDKKEDNHRSHQYLGTYYLLVQNNTEKAEQEYLLAYQQDSTDATILNDLGVLAWARKDLSQAGSFFSRAVESDPMLLEAKYNLALTFEMQGRIDDATDAWNTYLRSDSISVWTRIAVEHLERLNE